MNTNTSTNNQNVAFSTKENEQNVIAKITQLFQYDPQKWDIDDPRKSHFDENSKPINPYFIGFDISHNPIIDNNSRKVTTISINGCEMQLCDKYVVAQFDKSGQPLFQEINDFFAQCKADFISQYGKYYETKGFNAGHHFDNLIKQKNIENQDGIRYSSNPLVLLGLDSYFVIGLDTKEQPIFELVSDLCYKEKIQNNQYITYCNYNTFSRTNYMGVSYPVYEEKPISTKTAYTNGFKVVTNNTKLSSGSSISTGSTGVVSSTAKSPYYWQQHIVKKSEPLFSNNMFEKLTKTENMAFNNLLTAENSKEIVDEIPNDWQPFVMSNNFETQFSHSVVGHSHIMRNTPCQDSSKITVFGKNKKTAVVSVSDGAGSAKLSHFGSKALVNSANRFIQTTYPLLFEKLVDGDETPSDEDKLNAIGRLIAHLKGTLLDLSEDNNVQDTDLHGTFLTVVIGTKRALAIKVGDGAIVIQRAFKDQDNNIQRNIEILDNKELAKGEFANQTFFINSNIKFAHVQTWLIDSTNIENVALMTDGLSERIISDDNTVVSNWIDNMFEQNAKKQLNQNTYYNFLQSNDFRMDYREDGMPILAHNGDDCTLAVIHRQSQESYQAYLDELERKRLAEERKKLEAEKRKLAAAAASKSKGWVTKPAVAKTSKKKPVNPYAYDGYWDSIIQDDYNPYLHDQQGFNDVFEQQEPKESDEQLKNSWFDKKWFKK